MATNTVKFPIAYKQNRNRYSRAHNKYYPETVFPETLDLKGLLKMVAFEQAAFTEDIAEGVIKKLTRTMVEMLSQGQAIKWPGLGAFRPTIEAAKNGCTIDDIKQGKVNIDTLVEGIHIRFAPESTKGEELTSKAVKDLCVFETKGVYEVEDVTEEKDGEQVVTDSIKTLYDMETWRRMKQNA